ncbi:hypothetical protein D4R08_08710 [Corynebacterium xerosis]|uniref:hypothetical protein n=1 Tax=Corynebacterium xerosis TaxID=1725 RepID=UPI000EAD99B2|nr:hypothetical protein [Corynebacterium xerosis]AYJ33355.1 hypothetical protein D4R08_08710 [Corynebacterium xerosis]
MTGIDEVHVLAVGPASHGVVKHGLELAAAAGAPVLRFDDEAELDAALAADREGVCPLPGAIHVAFTDALFGGPAEAPRRIRELARGRRLWLGLHDVPQEGEGEDRLPRRRACYAAACEGGIPGGGGIEGVVVNSDHEKRCLAAAGVADDPVVIPLPIPRMRGTDLHGMNQRAADLHETPPCEAAPHGHRGTAIGGAGTPVIGVFGFLYPGKGIEDVIDAAAALTSPVEVVNIGGVSDGHEHMVDDLAARARDAGLGFRVTGHIDDADLPRALAAVDVPVTAHRHISASGSLNSWLGAGRRPIAVAGEYVAETAARWPGHLNVVERGNLAGAIADALADPASTWADTPAEWSWDDVAAAHREAWR